MLKHLRTNPIALLALFIALGGTSYAVAPVPSGPTKNVTFANDNTLCLDGLKGEPRNVQVTSGTWPRTAAVSVRPANGPCAGKQLQVSLHAADGSQPYYHEFFISVQS